MTRTDWQNLIDEGRFDGASFKLNEGGFERSVEYRGPIVAVVPGDSGITFELGEAWRERDFSGTVKPHDQKVFSFPWTALEKGKFDSDKRKVYFPNHGTFGYVAISLN